jgi:hypothetical protein
VHLLDWARSGSLPVLDKDLLAVVVCWALTLQFILAHASKQSDKRLRGSSDAGKKGAVLHITSVSAALSREVGGVRGVEIDKRRRNIRRCWRKSTIIR